MHAVDGLTHRQIAQQLGITETQSAHAAKRVSDRMRQAVRDLLREEGVPAAGLEAAVAEVLALVEESSDG
jgi:DNA-directed RNA polymerase specialized sigma24 family protein